MTVLALVNDDAERRTLASQTGCIACSSIASLEQRVTAGGVRAVVYEPGLGLTARPRVLATIEEEGIRLVVRMDLGTSQYAELVPLVSRITWTTVSIRANASPRPLSISEVVEAEPGPLALILARLEEPLINSHQFHFAIGAIALGSRRHSVRSFAGAYGLGQRSLQLMFQRLRMPTPHRMLIWGQALWTAWRVSVGRLSCKQAALRGGFDCTSAMSASLRDVMPVTPRRFREQGHFERLVDSFVCELARLDLSLAAPSSHQKLVDVQITSSFI